MHSQRSLLSSPTLPYITPSLKQSIAVHRLGLPNAFPTKNSSGHVRQEALLSPPPSRIPALAVDDPLLANPLPTRPAHPLPRPRALRLARPRLPPSRRRRRVLPPRRTHASFPKTSPEPKTYPLTAPLPSQVLHRTIYIFALRYKLHLSDLVPRIHAGKTFRVLNVAYATALWATWMMELYPTQIHVVGIDLERVHPAWLQSRHENLELLFPVDYNDSVWGGLTPASFDYLHMDNLSASVADWGALLRTAFRYLKPCTGRIELVLLDWTPRAYNSADFPRAARRMRDRYDDLKTATSHLSFPIAYRADTGALLQSAAFVDVCEEVVRIPLCKDTGTKYEEEIAMCFRGGMSDSVAQAYQGMAMQPFTQVLGYTPERVFEVCELVARIPYHGEVRLYHDL
ncbi:hypothetical protein LTR12_005807 [Friedmanniomyces endolithicus]|nr:hypothetical protein LTR12_005807 [Friedmanniomyces endolithicus]